MTAVIGVLNKQAIAVAADSAVTISGSNGRKIFNTANKIFTLSRYHPVGVMIYNSASFMYTPWEIIIKMYREQLSTNAYSTLDEYITDFLSFLKSKDYFTNSDLQRQALGEFFVDIFNWINIQALQNFNGATQEETMNRLKSKVDELHSQIPEQKAYCPEFDKYTLEEFNAYSASIFEEAYRGIYENNGYSFSEDHKEKLKNILFEHVRSKVFLNLFTGLIFVGFGQNEIYPSLIPLNISGVIDNRLRYFIDENLVARVSPQTYSAIRPFAQTDVINTVLTGVDPGLNDIYITQFHEFFAKYNKLLIDKLKDSDEKLADNIRNIDTNNLIKEYVVQMQQVQQNNYINPLMNAVANLSKEDLAEMAESLIYLTYLKRRITFAEESVGGPVDVALISKGDGFIWMKRKHYFKPELNHHFFANYLTNPQL